MGKVILHVTMSLDGFMAGPDISVELPMGRGGPRLHDWIFNASSNTVDAGVIRELFATTGAVVLGRWAWGSGRTRLSPHPPSCSRMRFETSWP
jgi:hypothetical protein